jgi:tRNA-(ms[2]io[6]A)-hydroxylase
MSGDGKRRLPLVKEPEAAREDDVDRPPWHWVFIGAIAVLIAWLILGTLLQLVLSHFYPWLGSPFADKQAPVTGGAVASSLLGLVLAAFGGGVFVGRFGVRAKARIAAASGAVAVVPPWVLVAFGAPADAMPLLLMLLAALGGVGALFALAGGLVGARLRPR